jgi:hypothetical protein
MRSPTILDVVQAVTDLAPSHPEVAIWWYGRGDSAGALRVVLVLEGQGGADPDTQRIGSELARYLASAAITVRMHRGADEAQTLHRLLTNERARASVEQAEGR